nr:DUF5522 domain-containing protein [uncultured Carboxylicivirga sp.]
MYIDDSYKANPLKEGEDYYMDPKGYRVMTAKYLTERGYCCGSGCRHCPYFPPHQKGNTELKE